MTTNETISPSLTCISDTTHGQLPRQPLPFKLTIFLFSFSALAFSFSNVQLYHAASSCIVRIDNLQEINIITYVHVMQ